jgi:hypothetical protein
LAGGSAYSSSPIEFGSKNRRWVSKKPTERKKGSGRPPSSAPTASGATVATWLESMSWKRS